MLGELKTNFPFTIVTNIFVEGQIENFYFGILVRISTDKYF